MTISTNEALETSSCNLLQDGIAEGMLAMSGSTALLIDTESGPGEQSLPPKENPKGVVLSYPRIRLKTKKKRLNRWRADSFHQKVMNKLPNTVNRLRLYSGTKKWAGI